LKSGSEHILLNVLDVVVEGRSGVSENVDSLDSFVERSFFGDVLDGYPREVAEVFVRMVFVPFVRLVLRTSSSADLESLLEVSEDDSRTEETSTS
jgi:hypothetical protein